MSAPEREPSLARAAVETVGAQDFGGLEPTDEELSVLSPLERFAFRLVRRMNAGRWKRLWTFCQRTLGAGWIDLSTYNLMRVYGLEHLEAVSPARPLLLVANHRSFFDMYAVSTVLFRQTRRRKQLFFPVRGRFFYDTVGGLVVNFLMGWWSMYPPFFGGGEKPKPGKRDFDKFSMRVLAHLCREGAGNVIGFHPEGMRNKSADPYALLRAQPGVGKLIKDARPQVIPVFIAGLGNNLARQVVGNWSGGEAVRVRFGPPLDFSEFYTERDSLRTYMRISEFVMRQIAALAEQDRAEFGHGPRRSSEGEDALSSSPEGPTSTDDAREREADSVGAKSAD